MQGLAVAGFEPTTLKSQEAHPNHVGNQCNILWRSLLGTNVLIVPSPHRDTKITTLMFDTRSIHVVTFTENWRQKHADQFYPKDGGILTAFVQPPLPTRDWQNYLSSTQNISRKPPHTIGYWLACGVRYLNAHCIFWWVASCLANWVDCWQHSLSRP